MAKGSFKVATCQFAVTGDLDKNFNCICRYIEKSARQKADIVHFPETALTGYAGTDIQTLEKYDWRKLIDRTEKIMSLAAKWGIWVILPSMHRLSGKRKPYNCLYLIDKKGRLCDRYDKRFCTPWDIKFYTPGARFVTFNINTVRCSLLICFDLRFPALYTRLCQMKVKCVFQSFYNAGQDGPSVHTHIMRQTMQTHAANNYFWISMSNSSRKYSPYPSCFISPDGVIQSQLKSNRPAMMINTVDTSKQFYDPIKPYRALALKGALTNGPGLPADSRAIRTKEL